MLLTHGEPILSANDDSDFALVTGPENYDTCAATTAYLHSVRFNQLKAGTKICVRTGERRLALAVVRSAAENPPGVPAVVRFHIVVWDQPTS